MEELALTMSDGTLIAETEDQKTRIHFKVRQNTTTLIINDYTIERYKVPFDGTLAEAIMHALKSRGIRHVLSDVLPDGMLPWCIRKGETLHCDLSALD